jgi:hypothetical protein
MPETVDERVVTTFFASTWLRSLSLRSVSLAHRVQ